MKLCKTLLWLGKIKQPSAKRAPILSHNNPFKKWVLTVFFLLFQAFFSPYFDLALQSSSSFRVRSTYVRLPFAFCCYLCLNLTPVLKIPDHPHNFFSSLLLLIYHFLISSGLRKTEIRINLLGLVFPAFYWMFGLERKFQGWSDKVSAAPKKESATKSWPTSMSETFMLHKFLTQTS